MKVPDDMPPTDLTYYRVISVDFTSLCTLTATHFTLIYIYLLVHSAEITIRTILTLWETPGIEPGVYQTSGSTT